MDFFGFYYYLLFEKARFSRTELSPSVDSIFFILFPYPLLSPSSTVIELCSSEGLENWLI